jgi:hypothetical protein
MISLKVAETTLVLPSPSDIEGPVNCEISDDSKQYKDRAMLSPRLAPGHEVVGDNNRYRLTEFLRLQGDKPIHERFRVGPSYFTPAHSWCNLIINRSDRSILSTFFFLGRLLTL